MIRNKKQTYREEYSGNVGHLVDLNLVQSKFAPGAGVQ